MFSLAPWYYKDLLSINNIMNSPEFYEVKLLNGSRQFEAAISLKEELKPGWISKSELYRNCDGSGTSKFKNTAVYKAISEALERLAFYELAETCEIEYSFDLNPTTTGMAAYPSCSSKIARLNSKAESIERWAIHEFNKKNLPIIRHESQLKNLESFEIITPFKEVKVSLLAYKHESYYAYGFAGGINLKHSFERAIIELDRNLRIFKKTNKSQKITSAFESPTDKTIIYFSTLEGYSTFNELVNLSPSTIKNLNPKVLCDKELIGYWSKYTKVWRYLLEDSYFDTSTDHTFFMF